MRLLRLLGLLSCLLSAPGRAAQLPPPRRLVEEAWWGGTDTDTVLAGQPSTVALHSSGTLVLVMPQLSRVLMARLGGQPFRQIGRQGQGPGEYMRPTSAGWQGDSLWIWDSGLLRLNWLNAQGRFLRSEQSRELGEISPLPDGTWIRFVPGALTDTARTIVLLDHDRAATRLIISYSWPKAPPLNIKLAQGAIVGAQPFANGGTVAVDPATHDLVVLEPLREPGMIRYQRVNAKGNILLERLLTLPVQPLTDAHYDAALSAWREGGGAVHRALPPQALREAIYRPKYLPTVRGGIIAKDGVIWLQSGPETASLTSWVLLAPSGRILNAVTGPPRLRLLAATGRQIIGVRTDQSGVVALVQYHLEP